MKKHVGLGFVLALALVALAGGAYWVGHDAGEDSERSEAAEDADDAAAKAASRTKQVKADAYAQGLKSGERRGYRKGYAAGLKDAQAQPLETAAVPEAPVPNPNCPAGQEPTADGGCAPYDESDGQIEPKINDPACYSDRPPAGCF